MGAKKSPILNRTLFTGDNLEIMRVMNSESVDLIYLDPPFNKKYVFPIGKGDAAKFGFKDVWGWDSASDESNPYLPHAELYSYAELIAATVNDNPLIDKKMADNIVSFLDTMGKIAGHSEMAYLSFMATRLVEMRRILKKSGSIYLHCDPTMSHPLKLLMDCVFGQQQFINELIWYYTNASRGKKQFAKSHDVIFWFSKSLPPRFNREKILAPFASGMTQWRYTKGGQASQPMPQGKTPDDVLTLPALNAMSKERTGYPTQKPIELLEYIIITSSNDGDMVLDPFCGCATTCIAAERLNRQWIGIDVASNAAGLVRHRLLDETKQGKIGEKVPSIIHCSADKRELPMRTDMGKARSKNIRSILYGKQAGNCNLCKRHFEIRDFHIDHIIARNKGGPDVDDNLQLLCGSCNAIKSDRTMEKARERLKMLGYI